MIGSAEILTAIRELTNSKQIDRTELHGLLQDGILAALAKKHGPTVQAEIEIDERSGKINIVILKTVVEEVTDPSREISLDSRPVRVGTPRYHWVDTLYGLSEVTLFAGAIEALDAAGEDVDRGQPRRRDGDSRRLCRIRAERGAGRQAADHPARPRG